MRLVRSLSQPEAERIAAAICRCGPFRTVEDLWRASGVRVASLRHLAAADAFTSMGLDRQAALWQVRVLRDDELSMFDTAVRDAPVPAAPPSSIPDIPPLPPIPAPRKVAHDYASTGLSLKAHPVSFMRDQLKARGAIPASALADPSLTPNGRNTAVGGIILVRQRPSTASGIVFITLEDETGIANLIIRPHIYQRYRKDARHSVAILARGKVERVGPVVHIMVSRIEGMDGEIQSLHAASRDFR